MKIFCVGRNYAAHAAELGNEVPDEPVIFMKPKSALLQPHTPFYYPEFTNELHYECELVLRISKNGKYIQEKFAGKYYDAITTGIDFTARDIQNELKEKGLPWEIAKGFDGSAPLSKFISLNELENRENIRFHLELNGKTVQKGESQHMIFSVDRLIAYVSQFISLKMGDVIFTGTPSGVGPVKIGDRLTGYIEDRKMLDFLVK